MYTVVLFNTSYINKSTYKSLEGKNLPVIRLIITFVHGASDSSLPPIQRESRNGLAPISILQSTEDHHMPHQHLSPSLCEGSKRLFNSSHSIIPISIIHGK